MTDYISNLERENQLHGNDMSAEKIMESLPLYGKERRKEELRKIDSAVQNHTGDLRSYTRLCRLQRDAESVHQQCIKAGR